MEGPDKKFLFELLINGQKITKFYHLLENWLEQNFGTEPLIFYRPDPLLDGAANLARIASVKLLRGELKNLPGKQQIEQLRQAERGLTDEQHNIVHLDYHGQWIGAVEFPGNIPEFLADPEDDFHLTLKQAIKINSDHQLAQTGSWTCEIFKNSPNSPDLIRFFLASLAGLFGATEAGYYVLRGKNYELRVEKGFSQENNPKRKTIPCSRVKELQLAEQNYLIEKTPAGTKQVYILLQFQKNPAGLVAVYSPQKELLEESLVARQLLPLTATAACILNSSQLTQGKAQSLLQDRLTGLKTKAYFMNRLREEIERARRYEQTFSLLLLDIDNFAEINETHGREVGDAILREIGYLLLNKFRSTDIPGRFDKDNFGIIFPNTALAEAMHAGQRLRQLVSEPLFSLEENSVTINFSGGLACFPEDGSDTNTVHKQAELALYQAKKRGKNRIFSTRRLDN